MLADHRARFMGITVAVLALAALACTCGPLGNLLPGSGGGGGAPNTFDGGDGLDTTGGGSIAVGGSVSGRLDSLFEAHNWVFNGTSGQTVTITAIGVGETDPRIKLIDPSGNVIAEDDDSGGGWNSLIIATLPTDGTYTIRIDVYTAGDYQITLQ